MTDVVLVSPPSRSINHYRPPLALLYLAGHLLQSKIKTKIIDVTLKQVVRDKKFFNNLDSLLIKIENDIISQIRSNQPKVVGITCYTPEYEEVLHLANRIKHEISPKIKIIVGGIHPTLYPQDLLEEPNSPVDFEVIGEGEETFLELCQKILKIKNIPYKKIKSIAYYKNSNFISTPLRPLQKNLDLISHPAYKLIDMEYYTQASPYSIRGCFLRSFYLLATRGCPSTCTFCVAKKLRQFNGGGCYTRVRSAKSLISEIKLLRQKYFIDSFYFIDDLFTINKENVANFCRLLKKENLNLLWGCSAKVSTLNEEIIKMMSQAGCIQIDFGVERGSDQALKLIQKGINLKMLRNIFDLCHKYKIRTFANFLVNLPQETKKDLNDITKLARELRSEIYSFNVFTPYPGTEIYDQMDYKFSKQEYQELFNASLLIKKYPHKYRFSKHKIDILKWANTQNKDFNQILPNLLFHLSPKYLKTIFLSSKKSSYLHQFANLLKELINQKIN
ncbi:B12-binding domain-containing radical SAM protein [Patescibacteria group bacterium]|nr:B12-binding domain-containing radical SAM protein [Patescibacteria group bacterium]